MDSLKIISGFAIAVCCLLGTVHEVNGQLLKKLGKAAERAAERTVERRVEKETAEKTDQALDSIFETGSNQEKDQGSPIPAGKAPNRIPQGNAPAETPTGDPGAGTDNTSNTENAPKSLSVYSKFDFVPGDRLLFFDDFSNDFVGDFPSKWNTNGGGELVEIGGLSEKWLKMLPGYNTYYIPDLKDLPDEFTVEFDVVTDGLDDKTSSQSFLRIILSENDTFEEGSNFAWAEYPFCQYIDQGIIIENKVNGNREIRNEIQVDTRKLVREPHHISIAVNEQRFRLWINEQKMVDVPRLLPAKMGTGGIKFHVRGIDVNKETVYLSNLKVAEGGVDLRKNLLADGKISTNGILFDSGSANIQPLSMGIIRQISQVLQQENAMHLKIVGHTDGDGDPSTNLELSKKRAEAVKNVLVSVYGVAVARLTTDGKGETEPVGDNGSADGRALNRRVEFIKI